MLFIIGYSDVNNVIMKIGQRIDLIELIDEQTAYMLYNYSWMQGIFDGEKGKQYIHAYYGKEGCCVWNYHIHSGPDSLFDKAFKKIGTFVITKLKCQP